MDVLNMTPPTEPAAMSTPTQTAAMRLLGHKAHGEPTLLWEVTDDPMTHARIHPYCRDYDFDNWRNFVLLDCGSPSVKIEVVRGAGFILARPPSENGITVKDILSAIHEWVAMRLEGVPDWAKHTFQGRTCFAGLRATNAPQSFQVLWDYPPPGGAYGIYTALNNLGL